jgi:gluconokinase
MVFLDGSEALIARRLAARQGHFMPPGLLQSQFDDLEPPAPDEGILVIKVDQPLEAQVEEIRTTLACSA